MDKVLFFISNGAINDAGGNTLIINANTSFFFFFSFGILADTGHSSHPPFLTGEGVERDYFEDNHGHLELNDTGTIDVREIPVQKKVFVIFQGSYELSAKL